MRQGNEAIETAGGRVILVGMGDAPEAEAFRERFRLPFPVICDPDRRLYDEFHLKRMGRLGLLSPFLALKGLFALGEGHLMGLPEGDIRQLAGAFVIDTGGRIRFVHMSRDPAELTSVDDLIDVLAGL